jgi:hypothetical protein
MLLIVGNEDGPAANLGALRRLGEHFNAVVHTTEGDPAVATSAVAALTAANGSPGTIGIGPQTRLVITDGPIESTAHVPAIARSARALTGGCS